MKPSVEIEGLREMHAALGELSKATARNVLKRVLTKAAEPVAERARTLVRVDQGQLRDSIAVSTRVKNKVGGAEFASVMRSGGTRQQAVQAMRDARRAGGRSFAEAYVGPSIKGPHGHWLEFGTSHSSPYPFMRPAWEQSKSGLLPAIGRELAIELDKAAKRAARKAKRLAAKAAKAAAAGT